PADREQRERERDDRPGLAESRKEHEAGKEGTDDRSEDVDRVSAPGPFGIAAGAPIDQLRRQDSHRRGDGRDAEKQARDRGERQARIPRGEGAAPGDTG